MGKAWHAAWRHRALYLLMLPGMAYFMTYKYGPMYGAIMAFKDYNISKGVFGSPWSHPWYEHFSYFYHSPYFGQILLNTFLISFYKLMWGMTPGILLALILFEVGSMKFKRIVQTVTYLPHFLSWVIVYGIVIAFLSEDGGLINMWVREWTGSSISFITSTTWFRSILVASDIWKDLGWSAIIYLAAIAGIDPSLYEAVTVDGGGRWRKMWHVTLPGIRSVIVLLLILRLGHMLDAGFDQIYIMYNIHVYPVADIIDTWVFRTGLEQFNFSLAAAVGLFKSVIGFIMVLTANRIAKIWGDQIW